jgi:hypothetical protein
VVVLVVAAAMAGSPMAGWAHVSNLFTMEQAHRFEEVLVVVKLLLVSLASAFSVAVMTIRFVMSEALSLARAMVEWFRALARLASTNRSSGYNGYRGHYDHSIGNDREE